MQLPSNNRWTWGQLVARLGHSDVGMAGPRSLSMSSQGLSSSDLCRWPLLQQDSRTSSMAAQGHAFQEGKAEAAGPLKD